VGSGSLWEPSTLIDKHAIVLSPGASLNRGTLSELHVGHGSVAPRWRNPEGQMAGRPLRVASLVKGR